MRCCVVVCVETLSARCSSSMITVSYTVMRRKRAGRGDRLGGGHLNRKSATNYGASSEDGFNQ